MRTASWDPGTLEKVSKTPGILDLDSPVKTIGMGFVAHQGCALRTRTKRVVWTCGVKETPKLRENLAKWGLNIKYRPPFDRVRLLHEDPPIFEIPNFLSEQRCRVLQQYARNERASKSDAVESDLYLNYRVNAEVSGASESSEAQALIADQKISEDELKASQKSGFRLQVATAAANKAPGAPSARLFSRSLSARAVNVTILCALRSTKCSFARSCWNYKS